MTDEQIDNGEGKGWSISGSDHVTPGDYDEVFKDLHIPPGEANQERYLEQNNAFRNCRHEHNVSYIPHFPCISIPPASLLEKILSSLGSFDFQWGVNRQNSTDLGE